MINTLTSEVLHVLTLEKNRQFQIQIDVTQELKQNKTKQNMTNWFDQLTPQGRTF